MFFLRKIWKNPLKKKTVELERPLTAVRSRSFLQRMFIYVKETIKFNFFQIERVNLKLWRV